MKKSLLALAVLGAYASVASAQSSTSWVKVDGTVDLNAKYVKNDGSAKRYSLSQDGINSSQLRFSGQEDLGGGLWAGFNLNSGINADTGSANTQLWNRRSTVSLGGGFGEIRLGRDYTPSFWNNTIYDAFGTNGLGNSANVQQMGVGTFVRANNSIGYFLPSGIGGVYGQFMAAASEGAAGPTINGTANVGANPGRYIGGRVGWAGGPIDVAAAYADQRLDGTAGAPSQKTFNVGGAYDLGVVKLMGYYDRDKLSFTGVDRKEDRFSFSAVVPIGQSEIHAGYDFSKMTNNGTTTKIDQFKATYQYNLSKRTALYATASRLNNKNGTANSVSGGTTQTAAPAPSSVGGSAKSTGFEAGLRHFF